MSAETEEVRKAVNAEEGKELDYQCEYNVQREIVSQQNSKSEIAKRGIERASAEAMRTHASLIRVTAEMYESRDALERNCELSREEVARVTSELAESRKETEAALAAERVDSPFGSCHGDSPQELPPGHGPGLCISIAEVERLSAELSEACEETKNRRLDDVESAALERARREATAGCQSLQRTDIKAYNGRSNVGTSGRR